MNAAASAAPQPGKQSTFGLTLGAIGIVYGDIGTSTLYAFREAVRVVSAGAPPAEADVLGILSLILWSLMIIVTVKYVAVLLRFSNNGEGGPLALMALARSGVYGSTMTFMLLGMAGAGLFFGDALITPAISVLSAVEGIEIVTPALSTWVVPITVVIILGLFMFQSRGTGKVSALFGPVMAVWFLALAAMGLQHIGDYPAVLKSLSPWYAVTFMAHHGATAFVALGAVFLAVTGAEALYADLGHFGRKPIQVAWIWFVFPALALNYLGQGALVLKDPSAADNPFFRMVSRDQLVPLVILSAVATVIASQAVITGAYSLTRQAINLGLLPRLTTVRHTSDTYAGQIYLPQINFLLMTGVLLLVLGFRSSEALAAAYGISVTGEMVVTAVLVFFVLWKLRDWPPLLAFLAVFPFLVIDGAFLASNLLKIGHGGWLPLVVASTLFLLMLIWVRGTIIVNGRSRRRDVKIDAFMKSLPEKYGHLPRVPGTAFFLSSDPNFVPASLLQNLRHNCVLHEKNVILSVRIESIPYVEEGHRSIITKLNKDFSALVMRFGFQEAPDVQSELIRLNRDPSAGLHFDWGHTSLFLNRRALRAHPRYGMPLWQDWIYIWLNRNAGNPWDYYRLPIRRVIEIGRHVMI